MIYVCVCVCRAYVCVVFLNVISLIVLRQHVTIAMHRPSTTMQRYAHNAHNQSIVGLFTTAMFYREPDRRSFTYIWLILTHNITDAHCDAFPECSIYRCQQYIVSCDRPSTEHPCPCTVRRCRILVATSPSLLGSRSCQIPNCQAGRKVSRKNNTTPLMCISDKMTTLCREPGRRPATSAPH